MAEVPVNTYDELPYSSHPFHYTHPDTLATVATMAGLNPPAVDRCRVLELGCAAGGNLIPMAEALPDCRFVGVDLSERQVASGREIIQMLKLCNIELKAVSIMEIDSSWGKFDYIICHGVFSWVPKEVQDKILQIIADQLTDQGVAYISYNTYPGWYVRQMVREMMLYHVKAIRDPHKRVQEAMSLLQALIKASGTTETTYNQVLKEEMEILTATGAHYIFHEHLEEVNQPFFFHDFVERAAQYKLQYLGEAQPYSSTVKMEPAAFQWVARASEDVIRREQYLDFMSSRKFRWTLLVHHHLKVNREFNPAMMEKLSLAAYIRPAVANPDIKGNTSVPFNTPRKVDLATPSPILKAAFVLLGDAMPRTIPYPQLCREVQRLARDPSKPMSEADRQELASGMLSCFQRNVVEMHVYLPPVAFELSARPRATPLAMLQASSNSHITNRRHRILNLDPQDVIILSHLDGTRDRQALIDLLTQQVTSGKLEMKDKNGNPPAPELLRHLLEQTLNNSLATLLHSSVLVG